MMRPSAYNGSLLLLLLRSVRKGVSGETVKWSDDGSSVVSYAGVVKGTQYVIE